MRFYLWVSGVISVVWAPLAWLSVSLANTSSVWANFFLVLMSGIITPLVIAFFLAVLVFTFLAIISSSHSKFS